MTKSHPEELADEGLKRDVQSYWDRRSCGTEFANSEKHSRAYFEEIEAHRYRVEPEIHSFAQFTRAKGLRVLEVGVGAGTDFLQWTRAGARAVGIDLTREGVTNTRRRLDVYQLEAEVLQADSENLPFAESSFDLVYTWGVIHHTARMWTAVDEIIRVLAPGGRAKIMIYNRHSAAAVRHWVDACLTKGRPWRSISWALWNHVESPGTKAYTAAEVDRALRERPVRDIDVRSSPSYYDRVQPEQRWKSRVKAWTAAAGAAALGWRNEGWFLLVEFRKA